MAIVEVQSDLDARQRLKIFFPTIDPDEYVRLLGLLRDKEAFSKGLEEISKRIWVAYNHPRNANAPNRFTRSIIDVANAEFGFSCQENVVLTAPADSQAFGKRIKDRVIWKDSFAAGHGEFAHSYQWLVAGHVLNWASKTGKIYADTAGVRSHVPLFVRDTGGMVIRPAQLWEFLVDCTLYKDQQFDTEAAKAATKWVERQLDNWCANIPTSSWFVDAFLRGHPGETGDPALVAFDKVGLKNKAKFGELVKRRGEGASLKKAVLEDSDLPGFYQELLKLYPTRNALTKETLRSANNVTTLSSQSSDLFVSIYDNHRNMVLLRKQNERLRLEVIQHLSNAGLTKDFFKEQDPRLLEVMVAQLIDEQVVSKSKSSDGLGGTTLSSPHYHGTLVKAAKEAAGKIGYQQDRIKLLAEHVQRSLHPIQVRKAERKDHYQSGGGFTAALDDPSIFHQPIPMSEANKKTMLASFHMISGTVNLKVYENQLIK